MYSVVYICGAEKADCGPGCGRVNGVSTGQWKISFIFTSDGWTYESFCRDTKPLKKRAKSETSS